MKRAKELAAEVREYCVANQNPAGANKFARYFREGYDAWGLLDKEHPLWTVKVKEWMERYRSLGVAGFCEAGETLLGSGKYEEGSVAIQFVTELRTELGAEASGRLAGYFRAGICNWAHTDVLSGEVTAKLLAEGRMPLEALADWRYSDLRFQRRAVPVSMLSLLKTAAPIGPLLDFVRPLMMDPERVVQQGMGWFLRESWKKYPKPVEALLKEWKDRSPRTIYQYATEKMTPEQRARFRAVKAKAKGRGGAPGGGKGQ